MHNLHQQLFLEFHNFIQHEDVRVASKSNFSKIREFLAELRVRPGYTSEGRYFKRLPEQYGINIKFLIDDVLGSLAKLMNE